MSNFLWPAVCSVLLVGTPESDQHCVGYLYEPAFCLDKCVRGKAKVYPFQEGDLMLATDDNLFWGVTHAMALAFHPHHSGIFFRRPDGTLGLLEAGPNDTLWIRDMDGFSHLSDYAHRGEVWIRRRQTPLTPEQSACLTDFATKVEGRRFALMRLGVLLTPFRDRGPLRTAFMGGPHGDRRRKYYCSELVFEAMVAGGLSDPKTTRPSASFPRDIFFGRSLNPYIDRHLDINCHWDAPARWVPELPEACK